jgi:tetratricopeptide (TPR) repeat protein
MVTGQWEKALPEAQEALRLDPNAAVQFGNLATILLALNRTEEARSIVEQALAKKIDAPFLARLQHQIAFVQGDRGSTESGDSEQTEDYFGRLTKAREISRNRVNRALRGGNRELATSLQAWAAFREAEFGNSALARQQASAAVELMPALNTRINAAWALARAGDGTDAEKIAESLSKEFPQDTMIQGYMLPCIHASVQLNADKAGDAIKTLQAASAYELGGESTGGTLYPVYIRGRAYLKLRQGKEAAAEFQKILNHRGIVLNSFTGAIAHLGLARAYVIQGDQRTAHAAYEDFLNLWNDADPDIPILKEAKAEYAKLR